MCGITGILTFNNNAPDQSIVRNMTNTMAHRGPDAEGIFNDGQQIVLGHRRLSIIDLSDCAAQPFLDFSGRYVLVFNGEMYNFKEVKDKINDYPFQSNSDTEVIIAAFRKWGINCIQFLNGMFAFAIWDSHEKCLWLARDRMGVKPLYYYYSEGVFIFASEVRTLLRSGLIPRDLHLEGLFEFLHYQSVGYSGSLVKGITQLKAGAYLRVANGAVEETRYWDLTRTRVDFDFADELRTKEKIRSLIVKSVERRMISDVPVGAFLSGGIDSSIIVGLMTEASASPVNTFTVSFEEKSFDESSYAQIIADKFATNHSNILLKPSIFLDELQNSLAAMDTPSGDGFNTYIVSKAIRQEGIKVALSGIGGDELFAGYQNFQQFYRLRQQDWFWSLPRYFRKTAASLIPGLSRSKRRRLKTMFAAPSGSIAYSYSGFREILSLRNISELTTIPASEDLMRKALLQDEQSILKLPILSQVSAAEYLGYTQHTLLKDADQMSMAVSLEIREPFFDYELVEFVLSIPDVLKKPRYPKSLLVESVKGLLPDEIIYRTKQGFVLPWEIWVRNELRSFCDVHIRNFANRPFVNREKLLHFWRQFLAGDPDIRWMEVWLFVILERYLDENNIN